MNLYSARILLTGATGGIGHAIARALAQRGARLLLTGRRTDILEPLAIEVGSESVAVDLADRTALAGLIERAGDVDVLIANAALPASGPALGFTAEEIDRALDVNLRAPMLLAHALAPAMVERGHGHLVFVSSLSGKAATTGSGVYSATKFGMRGFALGLRADLMPHGVGVSTIFPGFVSGAGMFADSGAQLPRYIGTKSPEQVAAAVVRAIERGVAEIDVAPVPMRIGVTLAGVAPATVAALQRRLGADKLASAVAHGQRDKR